ncbi:hypothetical protein H4Q26_014295 [Puccinia striiformis f. sp. tritici PST-130]|nr:hypothetical protein H4Q26_014295 [Puccinia striiformis f. sp. tritici PST-130]
MARHPQKRIRNQLPPEDNTEHNDQPTVDSNNEPEDEESTSSSAAPMGPDSTDEQRLGKTRTKNLHTIRSVPPMLPTSYPSCQTSWTSSLHGNAKSV